MKQNLPLLIPVFIVFLVVNGCDQKDASENPMPQRSLSAAEVQELKQWVEKGDAEAQTYLGWMYANGI